MATYLVTGGAGFIGSFLVRALVERGEKVRCFDNFSEGSVDNLSGLMDRIEIVFGDLRLQHDLDRACRGVDYIFHEGAIASVQQSIDDPLGTSDVNLMGTMRVIEAARKSGVKRIVFAGSSSIYGNHPDVPLKESCDPRPLSPYAIQKLSSEFALKNATLLYGVETVCLRYFNVFGPQQSASSPYSGVIARFATQMLGYGENAQQPLIYGDGKQSRDFVYIDDVVEANLVVMHAPKHLVAGRSFNIGTGLGHSVDETCGLIAALTGFRGKIHYAPGRRGDIRTSVADITAAQAAFQYQPKTSFGAGLENTIKWYWTQKRLPNRDPLARTTTTRPYSQANLLQASPSSASMNGIHLLRPPASVKR